MRSTVHYSNTRHQLCCFTSFHYNPLRPSRITRRTPLLSVPFRFASSFRAFASDCFGSIRTRASFLGPCPGCDQLHFFSTPGTNSDASLHFTTIRFVRLASLDGLRCFAFHFVSHPRLEPSQQIVLVVWEQEPRSSALARP